ncbi:HAMP domain-containing sensor histidine kinase [Clostridium paraputrificum]|uniref:sensor histidine kinase n=1 Tax=Clostridium TaxID=1485 RepID=UPI0006673394|nr:MULTISPECIES: HAMP domain-containing sensor histidine kinase [Clostridium]MDB2075144.1 HAMP domain-containing sensor histidine kinase [Clostridium paraputrificum]MDB2078443.1 HAMP domain-containing sensor histidine kinase [Clostridium paraputrificum]MDB2092409.1 HAMP domain-containing sensor histidine kinase [Clostridium paraputrificum]MDB2099140.1 HAMP domain-containing sensor histidine kinase [Clostridium paraputrificum]MDB2105885.1 HAMP domain-containing sensor histidine kinase [Clostrid
MNLKRLYNNPEAKKITSKFLIIFLVGVISIFGATYYVVENINKTLLDQNISVISSVIENKEISEVIKGFYEIKDGNELVEAKEILESYGYDDDLSIMVNEVTNKFYTEILVIFIPIIILFTIMLYLIFIKELKDIYVQVDNIVKNISDTSNGKFKKIEPKYEEGDVAILTTSLNYMGERVNNSIQKLNEDKDNLKDFLSDISHQLKTPLASLVMFTDLMKENEDMPKEDRAKFLDKCDEQEVRMEWLIMNLLKVGRLEAGAVNFKRERQPLRETIELAVSSLIGEAERKNQKLIVTGDLDCEVVHDREWLGEAISNITKNAIEHTQDSGEIEIRVSEGKIIKNIYIKDNGPGIPKDIRKKVFKRFYKGESSTDPKSIGIGLSLSKSIVEELGGEIRLISEEGEGTTFIISFIEMD